jgi:hypothetical protein
MTTVSALMYRSVAREAPSAEALHHLLRQCRERNACEGLTGFLVLHQGRFVQWLEGPEAGLQRVWASIERDARHHRVELLQRTHGTDRLFAGWQMQLGMADTADAPPDTVPLDAGPHALAQHDAAQALMQAVSLRLRLAPTAELMRLSLADDAAPWQSIADRLALERPALAALNAAVLAPLSRALGDAWLDDEVGASELLIGLARLQTLLRRVYSGSCDPPAGVHRTALVASLPREPHVLGVCVAATAFDLIGWRVQCCFPKHLDELLGAVQERSVDVLQLTLSDSLHGEDRMAELAATVRAVRRASVNPQLVVLLGGRAFSEQPGLAVVLGADGDGLDQGTTAADLQSMLEYTRTRGHSPAAMAAQATLNDVALHLQRRRYGIAEEAAAPDGPPSNSAPGAQAASRPEGRAAHPTSSRTAP